MPTDERVQTGVPGLDQIVGGGLPEKALYLLKGDPGTGKTTMGLQFLVEGPGAVRSVSTSACPRRAAS